MEDSDKFILKVLAIWILIGVFMLFFNIASGIGWIVGACVGAFISRYLARRNMARRYR